MTASTDRQLEAQTVARLRAAGCVFAEDEARLFISEAGTADDLAVMVEQRVAGVPLEHILGWVQFCGLRVGVDHGVFVPRRRTELLVRQAAALGRESARDPLVVVDLCCGSGAVGVALAASLGAIELYSVDIDPVAVQCARRNVLPMGGRVYEGDLYEALPQSLRGHVDLLVANTPYVPTEAVALMPPEARDHEPRMALDGGVDGLALQRRVIAAASTWLAPGGYLLLETSESQAPSLVEAYERGRLSATATHSPDEGATVVIGTSPGSG